MTTHKAIREALEADEYLTVQVAKADLRALLADLDAKTAEVERLQALRPVAMTEEQKVVEICERIGFGRVQQIAGDAWEQRHNCAPRGRMGVTVRNEKPATTERKGEPVVWADIGAWLWVKLADYCRRKGLNPHHENALFSLPGELRAMLARTSPQVPEDVMMDAERYRKIRQGSAWPCAFASHDAPEPLTGDDLDAAIDAARKEST